MKKVTSMKKEAESLYLQKICGSSSSEVFLKKPPTLVIHFVGSESSCVGASWGVSMRIVRNFKMVKCFLCMPILFCRNKTGPLLSILIARAMTSRGSINTRIAVKETEISKSLLKKRLYILVILLCFAEFCRFYGPKLVRMTSSIPFVLVISIDRISFLLQDLSGLDLR